MKRIVVVATLAIVAAVVIVAWLVPGSGASFVSSTSSSASVSTAAITDWLHQFSQSTDPNGLTGYYVQRGGTSPAATGSDFTLAANLGTFTKNTTATCSRVLTIATPSAFPAGSSATVTASLVADSSTGSQPITGVGFASIGSTSRTNPISLGVGQKRQLNLTLRMPNVGRKTYYPHILITVTYSGYTGGYYQFDIPVTVATS
jgi:hypothetical protein